MVCFPMFRWKKNSRSKTVPVFWWKKNCRRHAVQQVKDMPVYGNVKIYSSKELKKATRNFCSANKLGQGSLGCVYLGKLENGQKVAIKVLSSECNQGTKEFLNDLSVVSSITHPNLVKLYGCCIDGGQKMMVYNYLENNSVAKTLFGDTHGSIRFDWSTRVKICTGVADGLAYLHEEVRPHIVHRDIKASHILLDKDLNPMISDFGLPNLFTGHMTHRISTTPTLGYLAPEYVIRGQMTKKTDVYCFGVLLLEIVSGRWHTDPRLPLQDQFLLKTAWALYESGDLESIIDKTLKNDGFSTEEAHQFLRIGLVCTQDTAKVRPSMSMVAKMLKGECIVSDKIMRPGLISMLEFMEAR